MFGALLVAVVVFAGPGSCDPLAVPIRPGSRVLAVRFADYWSGTYPIGRAFVPVSGCPRPIDRP